MTPKVTTNYGTATFSSLHQEYDVDPETGNSFPRQPVETFGFNVVPLGYTVLTCPVPNFRGDFRNPNPHSYSVTKTNSPLSSSTVVIKDGGGRLTDSNSSTHTMPWGGATLDFGDPDNEAYNNVIEKLYKRLRGDLDLSVSAFQAKQTRDMFRLSKQFEDYFIKRASKIRKLGSAWLQYQYGWKPLLSDIYAVTDELIRQQQNKVDRFKAKAEATGHDQFDLVTGTLGNRTTYSSKGSRTVKYRIGASFVLFDRSSLDRWTSLNPLSIAWELLPYSFVVDWAYDVGGYLRSAETAILYSSRFNSGYISKLEIVEQTNHFYDGIFNQSVFSIDSGTETTRTVSFSRTLLQDTPFPRPPQLDVKLGASRLLSAAGLLSQHIGAGSHKR